mmetsp:Transcript_22933/g.48365  ORF Transcript_22933/g.48365 Transcript_22933/m.48365 type:complete len:993 (-) Transcript_22933:374-3352(-)
MDETQIHRFLQDNSTNDNGTSDNILTDTETIRNTCLIYGSIFAALFLVYLFVRSRYPQIYNPKKTYPVLHVPIADDSFGFISWIYNIFEIDSEDIREQCGMDALSTIRILEMGVKLSLVGVFNSAFLAPTYALMGNVVVQSGVWDPVMGVSLSNLEQGSHAAIATTIAAYIFFGCFMHWTDKDFEWFTYHRHKFLGKKAVPNYSVFLSGLTEDMRTNKAIEEYFGHCFSLSPNNAVADVHVALVIPNLEKKVAKRDALVPKLEHAMNVLTVTGETPTHTINKKLGIFGGEKVESVPAYTEEIDGFNDDIGRDIERIEAMQRRREEMSSMEDDDVEQNDNTQMYPETVSEPLLRDDDDEESNKLNRTKSKFAKIANPADFSKKIKASTSAIKSLITGEDGAPRNAAFVSFATLTSTNLARQAVHNEEPWCCVPKEPPMPHLVNWKNVGKTNESKQIGELISLVLTTALCIFWTVPVTFVASLSNVEKLTEVMPFLKAPVEKYAWFSGLLALIAPLILVVFLSLLPHIILFIVKFEGQIEIETMQHPSLYSKLAAFTILQTFFMSTISSTLFSSLQLIIEKPTSVISLVAATLPAQSAYFIQIILVQNLLSLGIELLRIFPVVENIVRKILCKVMGHNLTEKERTETFMGLRSLDNPLEYYFGRELGSKTILLQMVLCVYGCMAPITSYFTLLVFGLLSIGFRNQFIYVYPIANDSGGKLWISFQRLSITCAIVAEVVLFIVLLLKESFIAAIMMVPLIVTNIIFDLYFKRRHYSITGYLPLGDCAAIDGENERRGMTHEWLKDAYLQPALKQNFPDSASTEGQSEQTTEEDLIVLADNHKEMGNSYMTAKGYQLALEEYSHAIDISPSGPNTYIYYSNRAAAFCYLGDYDAAIDDCKKSIELNPTYEKAHTRLGLSLYFKGDYQGAIDAYEESLDLDPTNQACLDYMTKAKDRLDGEKMQDSIEVESPSVLGGACWGPYGKSNSFDPSIVNQD